MDSLLFLNEAWFVFTRNLLLNYLWPNNNFMVIFRKVRLILRLKYKTLK
jgi:hypothetical protein